MNTDPPVYRNDPKLIHRIGALEAENRRLEKDLELSRLECQVLKERMR